MEIAYFMMQSTLPSATAMGSGLSGSPSQQLQALQNLMDLLVFSDLLDLKDLAVTDMCVGLLRVIDSKYDSQKLCLALQCVVVLIPKCPSARRYFFNSPLFESINRILSQAEVSSVAECCFRILALYAPDGGLRIGSSIELRQYFKFLPTLPKVDKHACLRTMKAALSLRIDPQLHWYYDPLICLLESDDCVLQRYCSDILANFFVYVDASEIRLDCLLRIMRIAPYSNLLGASLLLLIRMCDEAKVVKSLRANLSWCTVACRFGDSAIFDDVLQVFQQLLPPPRLPRALWYPKNVRFDRFESFVGSVASFALDRLLSGKGSEAVALQTLAACCSLVPRDFDASTYPAFVRMTESSPVKAAFLLSIAATIPRKQMVYRSGLLDALSRAKLRPQIKEWGSFQLNRLAEETRQYMRPVQIADAPSLNLSDLLRYLSMERIFPFEFVTSSLLSRTIPLLMYCRDTEDLGPLINIGNGLLEALTIPAVSLPVEIFRLSKSSVPFLVHLRGKVIGEIWVRHASDLLAIEGWYNLHFNSAIVRRLEQSIRDNDVLRNLCRLEPDLAASNSRFALYCRAFQADMYHRWSFKIKGQLFSAFDSVAYAISRSFGNRTGFDSIAIDLVDPDIERAPFLPQILDNDKLSDVLRFVALLRQVAPSRFTIPKKFQLRVFEELANGYGTVTMLSPAAQVI
jgi:hypothetical protein